MAVTKRNQALEILQDLRELGVPDASLLDYLMEDFLSGDVALAAMESAEEEWEAPPRGNPRPSRSRFGLAR